MKIEFVLIISLIILYFSLVLGSWIKMQSYGVKRFKIWSVGFPLVVVYFSTKFAWDFANGNAAKVRTATRWDKMCIMLKLMKFNIIFFPVILGVFANSLAIAEQEAYGRARNVQVAQDKEKVAKERTIIIFGDKSQKLYNVAAAA